jgi:hypothetical protein
MKKIYLLGIFVLLLGCQKTERGVPVPGSDVAPGPVSNVKVKDIPGGATLSYTLPKSGSLLYVLAEYSIGHGAVLDKKASYYNNSLTIEGFPDTASYDVKLYAVSRGDKRSTPVTVKIRPLTPPVISVFRSLSLRPTFGGVNVQFVNPDEANVKITVLTPDSLGVLYPADIYYTQRDTGNFSARGFAAAPRKFGVFVRDRWNNYSDTLYTTLTPFFEEQIDKSKFQGLPLPTDTYKPHLDDGFPDLWDNIWDVDNPVFHTSPGTGMPQWFTFDLGDTVRLSRMKLYHRLARAADGTDGAFYAGDPEVFEIWGSNDPATDGSWGSWTLLGHFTCIKPSGQTTPTSEDIQYACVDGENFDFPVGTPPVRYLRFKTMRTWGNVDYVYISELSFWGSE